MILGILVSGNLGCHVFKQLLEEYKVELVFTDKNSEEIIQLCSQQNIPYFAGNPRGGKACDFISHRKVDVLVSVNYLFLIQADVINLASQLAFNLHGSLLPKYRGRTPHVWAIINNEQQAGVTAHIIDENCDTGGILEQLKIPVEKTETGGSLLNKYEGVYLKLIKSVLNKLEKGKLVVKEQDDSLATYFGKRSPTDGEINWNWSKERVYNWIRAQSHPYPGAFFYLKGKKIIVDFSYDDNLGFHGEMPNGKVLAINPVRVKLPNGVLSLKLRKTEDNKLIRIGEVLS